MDTTAKTIKSWIDNGERFEGRQCSPNLYLRYRKADRQPTWRFRYQFHGVERVLTIGRYDVMTLAQARAETKNLSARVVMGYDVAAEKQGRIKDAKTTREAEANAYSVAKLADEYFDRQIAGKVKHPNVPRRQLEEIKNGLGRLNVIDVEPHHIDDLLQKIVKRGAPTTANDVLYRSKALFKYAVKRRVIKFNPAGDLDNSDAGGTEKSRDRALSVAELVQLFQNMRESNRLGHENALTLKLLLALCVRKQEFSMATWNEFDLEAGSWNVPEGRTKTGVAISIPLAPVVIGWLKELKRMAGGSEWVLPARKMQTSMLPYVNHSTINRALVVVQQGIKHFTVHDLRRTSRTHLAKITNEVIAERCLNHKIKGVGGVYDRYDYFDERKAALTTWANLLDQYDSQGGSNVVPIKASGKR